MSLLSVLRSTTQSKLFLEAHPVPGEPLEKFFAATMDEVRLYWASEYTRTILKVRDLDDSMHFRDGVARRELHGDIAYPDQRDHSAHTLYNYLLGWVFLEHCPHVAAAFDRALQARGTSAEISETSRAKAFAIVWTWASLLHDVGYLFEGGLTITSTDTRDPRIIRGVEVARDFFENRFWMELELPAKDDRDFVRGGVESLVLSDHSLGTLADSLRTLPRLETLRTAVERSLTARGHFVPPVLFEEQGLPRDVFALWALHYRSYGQEAMALRVEGVAHWFDKLMCRGLPGPGIRLLDHAVCSGLLLLQYCTLYYALDASLGGDRPSDHRKQRVWDRFRKRRNYDNRHFWWTLNTWGTAAAAIHNIVQTSAKWTPRVEKLVLDEDPIAYLGVLVDILEEWDRYRVRRGVAFGDEHQLPLQACDVGAEVSNATLHLRLPAGRKDDMSKELNKALVDWDHLVVLI